MEIYDDLTSNNCELMIIVGVYEEEIESGHCLSITTTTTYSYLIPHTARSKLKFKSFIKTTTFFS